MHLYIERISQSITFKSRSKPHCCSCLTSFCGSQTRRGYWVFTSSSGQHNAISDLWTLLKPLIQMQVQFHLLQHVTIHFSCIFNKDSIPPRAATRHTREVCVRGNSISMTTVNRSASVTHTQLKHKTTHTLTQVVVQDRWRTCRKHLNLSTLCIRMKSGKSPLLSLNLCKKVHIKHLIN